MYSTRAAFSLRGTAFVAAFAFSVRLLHSHLRAFRSHRSHFTPLPLSSPPIFPQPYPIDVSGLMERSGNSEFSCFTISYVAFVENK
jgi:hypothetical protein